ncbi:MAG: trehalose-6-phosphate synthase [Gemmatimonadetes bacterium]|nr:trehalose-6-phosphate synthase [Gemmatimonadota bacterium]
MRLSLRFIAPLLLLLALFAWALSPVVDRQILRWFVRDLDIRASFVANAVQEPVRQLLEAGDVGRLRQYFARLTSDERLFAVGYCPAGGGAAVTSPMWPTDMRCDRLPPVDEPSGRIVASPHGALHVSAVPLELSDGSGGTLVLVHDMSFIDRRSAETRKYIFYLFILLGVVVSLLTVAIAQLSWRGWVNGLRALMRGEVLLRPSMEYAPELTPVARDLRELIRNIETAHRSRAEDQVVWTPESLREMLHGPLRGQQVIVVSNRQPYIHERERGAVVVRRPASGLVTALEPIMRACSGVWIAHGNGSADRTAVDARDHVAVPPDAPSYDIRRIWLTPEEEAGYYYGFANEGLWPLCHIAHVRPTFRTADWETYVRVNQRFADAVAKEATSSNPIVLVQDFHLALAPRMIRNALPSATIITFWHIPWPNPEAFAICPWRSELLDGLLGSTVMGFHTQFHCNNFFDTVDRLLEARVDREMFTVTFQSSLTTVKRYPISIEWPTPAALTSSSVSDCRAAVRDRHDLPRDHAIGVGVDRLDYTKGIEERFRAVERLLELRPEWVGRFSFIQLAAPTRTSIEQYQDYEARVRALARRINDRFSGAEHPPIILAVAHHSPAAVYEYYRAANLCFVSSLHDGMNLVAKEFVAARDDERSVLVLSRFTGAARELPEALIVNPYDADQCALALHLALTMTDSEQRDRMQLMRGLIREFSVYRWAGRMLVDATDLRRRERVPERSGLFS